MKIIKTALLSAIAFLFLGVATPFAGTVNWGAATDNGLANASGVKLPAGSLLLVGAFDITDAVIQANASNVAFLSSHFSTFGTSSIGNNVGGQPGFFFQQTVGNFDTTTPFPVAGLSIYIWAFNASTMGAATQQGIFSQTLDADWDFPHDSDIVTTTTIDITDLTNAAGTALIAGADIVVGNFQQGPGNTLDFNLAVIPEPSTYALVLVGGIALFYLRRRRLRAGS